MFTCVFGVLRVLYSTTVILFDKKVIVPYFLFAIAAYSFLSELGGCFAQRYNR